jgi:hypothetical protein
MFKRLLEPFRDIINFVRKHWLFTGIVTIMYLLSNLDGAISFLERFSSHPSPPPTLGESAEGPIEKRSNDDRYKNRCAGAKFDILSDDLNEVGGERFLFPDKYDDHIASPAGRLFQGSKKTNWECGFPFEATISAVPKKESSIGLFLEFGGIFKVILGDGDRRSIKVEKNDRGDRGPWTQVYRTYLPAEIELNKEIVLTVKAKMEEGKILLKVEIIHSGRKDPVILIIPPFRPQGVSLEAHTKGDFRVGINDYRYQGFGSLVRLDTLSIKEGMSW